MMLYDEQDKIIMVKEKTEKVINKLQLLFDFFNFIKEYKSVLYFSLFLGIFIPFSYLHYIEASYAIINSLYGIYVVFSITLAFLIIFLFFIYAPLWIFQEYAKSIRKEIELFSSHNGAVDQPLIIRKAKLLNRNAVYSILVWIIAIVLLSLLPENFINRVGKDQINLIVLVIVPLFFTPVHLYLQVHSRYPCLTVLLVFSSLIAFIFTSKENSWGFALGIILASFSIISFFYDFDIFARNLKRRRWKYSRVRKGYYTRIAPGNRPLSDILFKYQIIKKLSGTVLKRKKIRFFASLVYLFYLNLLLLFLLFFLFSDLPGRISMESLNNFLADINSYLYRVIILIFFSFTIYNNEGFFDLSKPIDQLSNTIILKNFLICIIVVLLFIISHLPTQRYPAVIFNSMRVIGLVEWPEQASLYVIDERYIQRNKLENRFLIYREKFVLPKLKEGNKQEGKDNIFDEKKHDKYLTYKKLLRDNEHVLYGYMAWNSMDIKIFCPVSETIQKSLSSKCLHIPYKYINSFL